MTVVVEGDAGRSLVTIDDVLVAVYRAFWERVVEHQGKFGGRWGEKKLSSSRSSRANGGLL